MQTNGTILCPKMSNNCDENNLILANFIMRQLWMASDCGMMKYLDSCLNV